MPLFASLNLALGAALALVVCSPAAGAVIRGFLVVLPGHDPAIADMPAARWFLGIAGGVWAGWGANLLAAARGAAPARAALVGFAVWCALDSLASVVNGAYGNVAVNLSWFAVALVALRRR